MNSEIWQRVSRTLFVLGVALPLYYAIKIQPHELPPSQSPVFTIALSFIISGIVANAQRSSSGVAKRDAGFRIASIGWGVAAVGILLEDRPSLSASLIVLGFVVFGVAIAFLVPTLRK